ncbi:MAG: hypothetical protein ABIR94_13155, partial [Rubrivivax sp.]
MPRIAFAAAAQMESTVPASGWSQGWRRLSQQSVRGFHRYANWLVSISWKRFAVLALLLIIASAMLQSLPPFSWRVTETVREPRVVEKNKKDSAQTAEPSARMEITIDENGVRISPSSKAGKREAPASASSATPASSASAAASGAAAIEAPGPSIEITLPAGLSKDVRDAVREAVREARDVIQEAIDEHKSD